jgi:hypothetical protein
MASADLYFEMKKIKEILVVSWLLQIYICIYRYIEREQIYICIYRYSIGISFLISITLHFIG